MGHVGRELAQRLDRSLEPIECPIERLQQRGDLYRRFRLVKAPARIARIQRVDFRHGMLQGRTIRRTITTLKRNSSIDSGISGNNAWS